MNRSRMDYYYHAQRSCDDDGHLRVLSLPDVALRVAAQPVLAQHVRRAARPRRDERHEARLSAGSAHFRLQDDRIYFAIGSAHGTGAGPLGSCSTVISSSSTIAIIASVIVNGVESTHHGQGTNQHPPPPKRRFHLYSLLVVFLVFVPSSPQIRSFPYAFHHRCRERERCRLKSFEYTQSYYNTTRLISMQFGQARLQSNFTDSVFQVKVLSRVE